MTREFTCNRRMLLLLALGAVAGCGVSTATDEANVSPEGQRYLLADEPEGAVSIVEAKAALGLQDTVVLIGRIAAGDQSPWHNGKAAFLLSDAAAFVDDSDHHHECHDHSNCKFCGEKTSITDRLAIVQFVDDRGEVLSVDARKLLGVQENDLVVVQGRGEVDSLGNLTLNAAGIYVRR